MYTKAEFDEATGQWVEATGRPDARVAEWDGSKWTEVGRNPSGPGAISRGLTTGIEGTKGLLFDVAPAMVQQALGYEEASKRNLEAYRKRMQQLQESGKGSRVGLEDVKDLSSFLSFAGEAFGEAIPSMATALAGGAGAAAGAARLGAGRLLSGQVAKRAAELEGKTLAGEVLSKEAALALATKEASQKVGQVAGALGGSALLNIPESYASLEEAGVDNLGVAFGVGALKSTLDALGPIRMLSKTRGPDFSDKLTDLISARLLKGRPGTAGFVGGTLETTALEGLTEGAQELLDQTATAILADKSIDWKQVLEAAAKGGIGAAPIGGAAGAYGARRKAAAATETQAAEEEAARKKLEQEQLSAYTAQRIAGEEAPPPAPKTDEDYLREAASEVRNKYDLIPINVVEGKVVVNPAALDKYVRSQVAAGTINPSTGKPYKVSNLKKSLLGNIPAEVEATAKANKEAEPYLKLTGEPLTAVPAESPLQQAQKLLDAVRADPEILDLPGIRQQHEEAKDLIRTAREKAAAEEKLLTEGIPEAGAFGSEPSRKYGKAMEITPPEAAAPYVEPAEEKPAPISLTTSQTKEVEDLIRELQPGQTVAVTALQQRLADVGRPVSLDEAREILQNYIPKKFPIRKPIPEGAVLGVPEVLQLQEKDGQFFKPETGTAEEAFRKEPETLTSERGGARAFPEVTPTTEVTSPVTKIQGLLQNIPLGLSQQTWAGIANKISRMDPRKVLTLRDLEAAAGPGVKLSTKEAPALWESLINAGVVDKAGLGYRVKADAPTVSQYIDEVVGSSTTVTPKVIEGVGMVPHKIRKQLYALGYNREDVAAMTPQEAQDILANKEKKSILKTDGWKLHLNANEDRGLQKEISEYLTKIGTPHKVGRSGGQIGKDITIYVGAKDDAQKLADNLQARFGARLGNPAGDVLTDDTQISGKIWGRFDIPSDKDFHQYGKQGVPILTDLIEWGPTGGIKSFSDAAMAQSHRTLEKRYGNFYTGTKENAILKAESGVSRRGFLKGLLASAVAFVSGAKATTPASKELVFHLRNNDISAALKHISENSSNPVFRKLAAMLMQGGMGRMQMRVVTATPSGIKDAIRFGYGDADTLQTALTSPGFLGYVDLDNVDNPTLIIFDRETGSTGLSEEIFLHEAVHGWVMSRWRAINTYPIKSNAEKLGYQRNPKDAETIYELLGLYKNFRWAVEKQFGANSPELKQAALRDFDEFLAYGLTSPEFRDLLSSFDYRPNAYNPITPVGKGVHSFFDKIYNYILKLFKITPTEFRTLDEFQRITDKLLSTPTPPDFDVASRFARARRPEQDTILRSEKENVVKGIIDAVSQTSRRRFLRGAGSAAMSAGLPGTQAIKQARDVTRKIQDLNTTIRKLDDIFRSGDMGGLWKIPKPLQEPSVAISSGDMYLHHDADNTWANNTLQDEKKTRALNENFKDLEVNFSNFHPRVKRILEVENAENSLAELEKKYELAFEQFNDDLAEKAGDLNSQLPSLDLADTPLGKKLSGLHLSTLQILTDADRFNLPSNVVVDYKFRNLGFSDDFNLFVGKQNLALAEDAARRAGLDKKYDWSASTPEGILNRVREVLPTIEDPKLRNEAARFVREATEFQNLTAEDMRELDATIFKVAKEYVAALPKAMSELQKFARLHNFTTKVLPEIQSKVTQIQKVYEKYEARDLLERRKDSKSNSETSRKVTPRVTTLAQTVFEEISLPRGTPAQMQKQVDQMFGRMQRLQKAADDAIPDDYSCG